MIYFLSDMFGFSNQSYGDEWQSQFDIVGLECKLLSLLAICGLDDEAVLVQQQTELHHWYLDQGINRGLSNLQQLLKKQDMLIGCSMGGYLAYLNHQCNTATSPSGTIMLSSTRLRTVTAGSVSDGSLFALFGEQDPYRPRTSHLASLGIDSVSVPGKHEIYKSPNCIFKLVCQRIVSSKSVIYSIS